MRNTAACALHRSGELTLFFLMLMISFIIFVQAARAAPALYDGNMRNDCSPTGICDSQSIDNRMSTPGVDFPKHGFVYVVGSFISPFGEWLVVDFDHRTVTATMTIIDRSTEKLKIIKKNSVKVNTNEFNSVIDLATSLWNLKTSSTAQSGFCTDVSQDFILFDGNRALQYVGSCPPNGISGKMNSWAEKQLQSSASS